jgi:hypothetical protein
MGRLARRRLFEKGFVATRIQYNIYILYFTGLDIYRLCLLISLIVCYLRNQSYTFFLVAHKATSFCLYSGRPPRVDCPQPLLRYTFISSYFPYVDVVSATCGCVTQWCQGAHLISVVTARTTTLPSNFLV